MLRFILITIISFFLCGLLTNDIDKMIGLTMSMSFFVTIFWELIRYFVFKKKN